uniref:Uncharacterized protein n=1 Tax=Arundo donax TaxID=35708 RepID=A0A0A8XRI0_ARUDO
MLGSIANHPCTKLPEAECNE